nr:hypothetical protein CFP56_17810 [Quercus suber]
MLNATIRCSFHKLDKVRCDAYLGWLFLRRLQNKCTLGNTLLLSKNFGTHLKDFGLDNCDVVIGTFILKANPIVNASFSEVEATTNSNMELQ